MHKSNQAGRIILLVLIVLFSITAAVSAFFLISPLFGKSEEVIPGESKTITRDGVDYYPRQDITTFLLMGIDQSGPMTDSGSYNNPGAADMLALLSFDKTNRSYSVLLINRDTMADMNVLGIGGKTAGTIHQQIALAHTYGNGLEESCVNTAEAVSKLLYGISIDHYLAINMDAIAILNDAVGGVTVNVTDDFSKVDSTIPKGTVTLQGSQALSYVRGRQDIGDELNTSRIERQEIYIHAFLDAFSKKLDSGESFALDTYGKIADFALSDLTDTGLSSLFNRWKDYTFSEAIRPEGTSAHPKGVMEFYPDKEKLEELVLRLYFAKK